MLIQCLEIIYFGYQQNDMLNIYTNLKEITFAENTYDTLSTFINYYSNNYNCNSYSNYNSYGKALAPHPSSMDPKVISGTLTAGFYAMHRISRDMEEQQILDLYMKYMNYR